MLPESVQLPWARHSRWLWMSVVGVCYLFIATAATITPQPTGAWVLIAGYAWSGLMCMAWSMACALHRLDVARTESNTA